MPILESDEQIRQLLQHATTIAVVGISDKPYRDSHEVASYLLNHGYRIIPVNPSLRSVFGVQAYPDLDAINGRVDIVNIFRRREAVPAIVDAALRLKAGSVWMQLNVADVDAAIKASEKGMQVVMDRCIMVEHQRLFF